MTDIAKFLLIIILCCDFRTCVPLLGRILPSAHSFVVGDHFVLGAPLRISLARVNVVAILP